MGVPKHSNGLALQPGKAPHVRTGMPFAAMFVESNAFGDQGKGREAELGLGLEKRSSSPSSASVHRAKTAYARVMVASVCRDVWSAASTGASGMTVRLEDTRQGTSQR